MLTLITGLVVFFAIHSISIVNEPWRDRMAARLGETTWQAAYSVLAIIGFALIVWGYGRARLDPVVLYLLPAWSRHLAFLLMLAVFPLFIAAYAPGRIQAVTRHPMLLGTILWATAHLLVNGTVADALLFGGFLAWAVADHLSMARRSQRPLPGLARSNINDVIAIVGGLGLYLAFIFGFHGWLFGVPLQGVG